MLDSKTIINCRSRVWRGSLSEVTTIHRANVTEQPTRMLVICARLIRRGSVLKYIGSPQL
jgi:hypothetical protein